MILKVALKSLKLGYVQLKTPKFPRPCTLACNCKIMWDSDFDEVGGLPKKFQSYPLGEASRKIMLNFQNITRGWLFLSKNCISKEFKSESCANHLSTQASKLSKQLRQSKAVRASKQTQTKAKRASMCASKLCRAKPTTSHSQVKAK